MIEIKPENVIWTMHWDQKQFPDKPRTQEMFEADKALAVLLAEEVVFTNEFWWEKEWPEAARKQTSIAVICNDIFAWGYADAERMNYEDIEPIYRAWLADRKWGSTKWCCIRRKEQPQAPVKRAMIADGSWSDELEALEANGYDRICRERYSARSGEVKQ